jgi:hypothetical protein
MPVWAASSPERIVKTCNELENINEHLYDHLQVLLWTRRYSWSEGMGLVSARAVEGCMEIVSYTDNREKAVAESIGMIEVESLIGEAVTLRKRKTILLGQLDRDVNMLTKKYSIYEISHRTLKHLKFLLGVGAVAGLVVLF